MRAVNLIPEEARRARGGGPAGASSAVYGLLGALAVLVVMVAGSTLLGNRVDDRRAELARVEVDARAAEARTSSLGAYQKFAQLSQERQETIDRLVQGRFDWSHALREIARVVPQEADLLTLEASASGAADPASGAAATELPTSPSFTVTGCTTSQARVARLLARLRAVDGVDTVGLASSEKADTAAGGDADCRTSDQRPQFKMTIAFKGRPSPVPTAPATPAVPTGGAG